ncbi:Uncharacterized protein PBTT_03473 [Plasmodiophora brassicae]
MVDLTSFSDMHEWLAGILRGAQDECQTQELEAEGLRRTLRTASSAVASQRVARRHLSSQLSSITERVRTEHDALRTQKRKNNSYLKRCELDIDQIEIEIEKAELESRRKAIVEGLNHKQ